VIARDGRLFVKDMGSGEFPLVVIDHGTFSFGATRFRFEVRDGKVLQLIREDAFSSRRYVPSSDALGELTRGRAQPAAEKIDDPSVLALDRWPSFRGIEARGLAVQQNLPDDWDVEEDRNVRWRTPIAGLGNSSPIVWDDKVFVTTAVSEAGKDDLRIGLYGDIDAADDLSKHSWRLLCLDAKSGKVLWERIAHEGIPPVKRHVKSSQANSTPATDGQHVIALFSSGGLYCYDFGGRLLWSKQLGVLDSGAFVDPEIQWGFGSSPIIYRNMVIVQCDIQQGSFIAAIDIETGSEIWKQSRDEIPSWGTPTVYESPHGPLLLTNATNFARAYDTLSGHERWQLAGNAAVTVPTPLVAYDLVFITSGYRPIQPIFAVRLDAQGDISLAPDEVRNSRIAWSTQRGGPYLPTPIVYGGYLYTCGNNGILTCYEATTGQQVYRQRVSGGAASSFTASPIAADGRIYLTAESGDVLVVKAGPNFEVLAENSLGEYCLATPAIAGGLLVSRTHRHVIAIGRDHEPREP
jgi:outer membrane protein assembly factor BamB